MSDPLSSFTSTGQGSGKIVHSSGKWFDSGICMDSVSSLSSSTYASSAVSLSSRLSELELESPTPIERDAHDARLIEQLSSCTLDTFGQDEDGDTYVFFLNCF